MKNAGLKCDICGATESQSGKPFTPAGLGAHRSHLHGSDKPGSTRASSPASGDADALVCDICGKNQNARGDAFRTESDIAQHKKRAHGVVVESGPAEGAKKFKEKKSERLRRALQIEVNHVKFCPQCGFNMEIVNAAMALVNGTKEP